MPLLLVLLLLLLVPNLSQAACPGGAGGTCYYVSNSNGDDSRNCSATGAQNENTPRRTIAGGTQCLNPGQTLYVRAGRYFEGIAGTAAPPPSGTGPSNRTTIAGYPGELVTTEGFDITTKQYLLIKNFHIIGTDGHSAGAITTGDGANPGDSYIRFEDLDVTGWGDGGQGEGLAVNASHNEFFNVTIHDGPNHNEDGPRHHGFYVEGSYNTFDGGEIFNVNGEGIQLYNSYPGAQGNVHHNIIKNIRIHHTGGSSNPGGITMTTGGNNIAYNNVIYDILRAGPGIEVAGSCTPNCQVYNNTIYQTDGFAIQVRQDAADTIVQNNIVYQPTNSFTIKDEGQNTTCDHNFNLSGCNPSTNNNPGFIDAPGGNFKLQSGSPAIDAGADLSFLGLFSTDIDGTPRPRGNGWDMGAYEAGGTGPPAPTRLRFTTQPQSTPVNQPMAAVVVRAEDGNGNLVSSYTGNITLTLNTTVGVVPFAATSVAFRDTASSAYPATGALDGNASTLWHTPYTPQDGSDVPYPHTLIINLGASYPVNGFRYLPRQDGESNGTIAHYQFAVSPDGTPGSWGPPVADATFSADTTQKTVLFPEKLGQYVWLQALTEMNGQPWAAVAELTTLYNAGGGSCPGALAGPPTQQAIGGQASFPGLSVTAPGTSCQLQATAAGLAMDTSATFAITGGPTHLAFVAQPSTVVLGQTLPPVTVQFLDLANNPFPTTQAVDIALASCPGASLGGTASRAANASGLATFNDLSVNTATCPGATLVANAFQMTGATSTPFAVLTTIPNPFLTGEWTPHGVSRHACHGTGGDTNFSSSAPTPHTHTLSCPLPANLLQAGARLEACALVTMTSGATALRATLSWLLGGTVLATNTSSDVPPGQTTNAWVCAASIVTAPLSASVPTYTSFTLVEPSLIGGASRGNMILQPLPRPTTSPLSVAFGSQWATAGDGTNALTLHSMIIGLAQ